MNGSETIPAHAAVSKPRGLAPTPQERTYVARLLELANAKAVAPPSDSTRTLDAMRGAASKRQPSMKRVRTWGQSA